MTILPSLAPLGAFESLGTSIRRRHRRLLLCPSFIGMFVGGRGVLVSLLAMFVSRFRVPLRLFVLAEVMMMGGLMMMMRGSVMISGGLMMMLAGRMLRGLCHGASLPTGLGKMDAGCSLAIDSIVPTKV